MCTNLNTATVTPVVREFMITVKEQSQSLKRLKTATVTPVVSEFMLTVNEQNQF